MDRIALIGYIAAALTTFSFVPQVVKIWKQRTARDISLIMFLMFTTGILFWMVYGFMIHSWPVSVANSITFILSSVILYFKLKYK